MRRRRRCVSAVRLRRFALLEKGKRVTSMSRSAALVAVSVAGLVLSAPIVHADNVTATVPVGAGPTEVAVAPDGSRVYVTNSDDGTVSVLDTAAGTVVATVPVGAGPEGVAVTPDGARAFVSNYDGGTVSVIDTRTDAVTATVPVGRLPSEVAITPDGTRVYVAEQGSNAVAVIDVATATVVGSVPVGDGPFGVAITPDGTRPTSPRGTATRCRWWRCR